jgi:hypothetical protein
MQRRRVESTCWQRKLGGPRGLVAQALFGRRWRNNACHLVERRSAALRVFKIVYRMIRYQKIALCVHGDNKVANHWSLPLVPIQSSEFRATLAQANVQAVIWPNWRLRLQRIPAANSATGYLSFCRGFNEGAKISGRKKIDQWRPLTERDSEFQTVGCRHSQPAICRNHSTPKKCAFVRDDNLCLLPPRSWKKIFTQICAARVK